MNLVLHSGNQLLAIEFMRPGLTVDRDHLNRFRYYIQVLTTRIEANSDLRIRTV